MASKSAGGSWGSATELAASDQHYEGPQVALDSSNNASLILLRFDDAGTQEIVQTATKASGGSWSSLTTPSTLGKFAKSPQIAVNASGDAAAAWSEYNGTDYDVKVATKAAGGTWSSTAIASTASTNDAGPAIAINSSGAATAVWTHNDGTYDIATAATKPAGGSWGSPTSISSSGRNTRFPKVVVDSTGRATAVWTYYDGSSVNTTEASTMSSAGSWSTPSAISSATTSGNIPSQLALDSSGNVTAAWQYYDGTNMIVQAASYGTPPSNSTAPSISGSAVAGQVLTADKGTWSGDSPTYTYQWRRCDASAGSCADIVGATNSTYTPSSSDLGSTLKVVVTATNSAAPSGVSATSSATGLIMASIDSPGTSGGTESGTNPLASPCVSKRILKVHLDKPAGERIKSVRTHLNGKSVRFAYNNYPS